jgi:hypothetical protein
VGLQIDTTIMGVFECLPWSGPSTTTSCDLLLIGICSKSCFIYKKLQSTYFSPVLILIRPADYSCAYLNIKVLGETKLLRLTIIGVHTLRWPWMYNNIQVLMSTLLEGRECTITYILVILQNYIFSFKSTS